MDAGVVNRRALRKMQVDNGVRRVLTRAFADRGLNQRVKVHGIQNSPIFVHFTIKGRMDKPEIVPEHSAEN